MNNRCSIRRALRGAYVESNKIQDSPRTPRKIIHKKIPKHSGKETSSPSKIREKTREGFEKNDLREDPHRGESVEGNSSNQITNKSPCKQCSQANRSNPNASPKFMKCSHGGRSRKVSQNDNLPITQGASDEQWVDGPRFHRSKVLESQKIKECELETWIDGPEATYGYMDDVKKSMIQKWVETQNSQSSSRDASHSKSPKHTQYREMTQFKTSEHEEISPKHKDKQREKRKSSDGRELKKDSNKNISNPKDSPHRRRSYNGSHQRSNINESERKQSVEPNNTLSNPSLNGSQHINQVPNDNNAKHTSPKRETHLVSSSEKEVDTTRNIVEISAKDHMSDEISKFGGNEVIVKNDVDSSNKIVDIEIVESLNDNIITECHKPNGEHLYSTR